MEMYFRAESFITVTFILSIMHTFVFFLALKVLDNRGTNGNLMNKCHKHKDDNLDGSLNHEEALANEETDVIEERERVSLLQRVNSSEFPIAVVENLRKEFSNKRNSRNFYCNGGTPSRSTVAVDNITFAVDSGEVFGLLGPNGAGKSTTIQMLIADVKPTLGNAFVGGCDVRSPVNAVFEVIGYCPQHDALWESITLREHLRFYAKIRGINEADVEKVADWYINGLGIAEHQNKYVQNLSGGTKRKLSYAISLLGQPKIVLLDEPSTGLDPASKRLLWNTISNSFSGSEKGAILTTHSMEEADALCSRIGIMVNGKFECVGISQHLKNKYGNGYFLEVKIHEKSNTPRYVIDERLNALDQYIKSLFPDSTMLERFGTRSQYKIPKENSQSLARIFTALEKEKSRCNFEEYSFSQSTLEQIFLEFAKKQRNEEDDNEFTESDYIMSHDRETVV